MSPTKRTMFGPPVNPEVKPLRATAAGRTA